MKDLSQGGNMVEKLDETNQMAHTKIAHSKDEILEIVKVKESFANVMALVKSKNQLAEMAFRLCDFAIHKDPAVLEIREGFSIADMRYHFDHLRNSNIGAGKSTISRIISNCLISESCRRWESSAMW